MNYEEYRYGFGILGHQFNKRLDSFALCYSQSLLLADLKKIIFFSGFKNPYKKIRETRKLKSFHEKHFVGQKIKGGKPNKNFRLKRLNFMPRNLD
jgi:hypothetical protein